MKKNTKIVLIIILVLLILGAIGGGAYYFYLQGAPKRTLQELGYNEQQITVITKSGITDEVIDRGTSALFIHALSETIDNVNFTDYYLISDKDLPSDKEVRELYSLITKMKELGYTGEETAIMNNSLDSDTLNSLLRTTQPKDLELFTQAIAHGYSIDDSLLLANGNSELAEMLFNEEITLDTIRPLLNRNYSPDEILLLLQNLSDEDYRFVTGMKYIPELAQLSGMDYFDMDLLPRYLLSLRSNQVGMDDVINWINNDNDYISASELDYSAMYHDETIPDNYASYTACINKQFALPADYEPADLEYLPSGYYVLYHPMRKIAANAFVNMSDGSVVAGYERILAQSNYRSYSHQKSLYDQYVSEDGVALADTYSARPGHSEHQTGLVTDIGTGSMDMLYFESYSGYNWILENAHKYGFIQRYPEGKEYLTGYEYESWHFRYVGVEPATIMYERNWTLDEYSLLFD